MTRPLPPRESSDMPTAALWEVLTDAPLVEDARVLRHFITNDELAAAWRTWRGEILRDWMRLRPGTRPSCWWHYDAPEPRRRLGGIGTPSHQRLANVVRLHKGIPVDWITRDDIAVYDRLGEPLGVPPLDEADPPLFESEAAYLGRLALLGAAERRRLTDADFEPVSILDVLDRPDDR